MTRRNRHVIRSRIIILSSVRRPYSLLRVEMTRAFSRSRNPRFVWSLGLILTLVSSFFLASCSNSSQETFAKPTVADDFDRADGSLGLSWKDLSDGRLKISSHAAAGTNVSGTSGAVWTSHAFTDDQYSQIEVTSAQLTGNQWIGPAVRIQ